MALTHRLIELAKVVRSKNAGPFEITFDIMFDDRAKYERVKKAGVINAQAIAGRMAQPVQRRTAVSRWMDLDSKRSRTEERNCIQSGSGISSSIELTSVLTSA